MRRICLLVSAGTLTLVAAQARAITLPDSGECAPLSSDGCLKITATDSGGPAINIDAAAMNVGAVVNGYVAIDATGAYDGIQTTGGEYGLRAGGDTAGVYGYSSAGDGVFGFSSSTGYGVHGQNTHASGIGVFGTGFLGVVGQAPAAGDGIGVKGVGPNTYGVWGDSTSGHGVYGSTASLSGYGVYGYNSYATGTGVYGHGFLGVVGEAPLANGIGVKGIGPSTGGYGLYGSAPTGTGVYGSGGSTSGGTGVRGEGQTGISGVGFYGVVGQSSSNGYGVAGSASGNGYGVFGINDDSSGYAGYFQGNVFSTTVFSTNSWSSSDARLKKDVAGLTYGLKDLASLRPVTFKWKDQSRGDGRYIGFLAQDVQNVIPEVVTQEPKSGTLAVNYTGLIPVLVKSIQEQQAIIARQDAHIQRQEAQIQRQDERIAMLEQRPLMSSMFSGGINVSVAIGALAALVLNVVRRRKERR